MPLVSTRRVRIALLLCRSHRRVLKKVFAISSSSVDTFEKLHAIDKQRSHFNVRFV